MQWLKENWFKICISLCALGIVAIVVFYYLIYIPEKENKDYIAERRKDCFEIYNKEKDNWSNTEGVDYNERNDICYVIYEASSDYWKDVVCDDLKPEASSIDPGSLSWHFLWQNYTDCSKKQFRKNF